MTTITPTIITRPVTWRRAWGRRLLIGVVVAYIALLILAPLVSLVWGAFREGLAPIFATLRDPQVLSAFGRSLWISAVVLIIHAIGGTMVAWVMVRHRFFGQKILNGLIDMPFAVSPVVVGYMLLLLFGRNGLLAPVLTALDIRVAFAWPGMVLAALFVTMPFMIR